ncbi:MAG: hypothetical protein KJ941_11005, partial [Bacteroidetes bacterium]|nr:hypothetical protein [Bacteroidota bacterium]
MAKSTNLNPIVRVGGRSFILNSVLIAINLLGLIFIVMGFHRNFEESKTGFLIIGFLTLALSIAGLVILKGRLLM